MQRHLVEVVIAEWEELKEELERSIRVGTLEKDHLSVLCAFETKLLAISTVCEFSNARIKQCASDVGVMRWRIRRKLFHEGTATNISQELLQP
jgi:hypothetical protein